VHDNAVRLLKKAGGNMDNNCHYPLHAAPEIPTKVSSGVVLFLAVLAVLESLRAFHPCVKRSCGVCCLF
jgi:hypothetical protein